MSLSIGIMVKKWCTAHSGWWFWEPCEEKRDIGNLSLVTCIKERKGLISPHNCTSDHTRW